MAGHQPLEVVAGRDCPVLLFRRLVANNALLGGKSVPAQNQLTAVMQRAISAYRWLTIDEIGYLLMSREQAKLVLQVIAGELEA